MMSISFKKRMLEKMRKIDISIDFDQMIYIRPKNAIILVFTAVERSHQFHHQFKNSCLESMEDTTHTYTNIITLTGSHGNMTTLPVLS